jgi:hypothetical protein
MSASCSAASDRTIDEGTSARTFVIESLSWLISIESPVAWALPDRNTVNVPQSKKMKSLDQHVHILFSSSHWFIVPSMYD